MYCGPHQLKVWWGHGPTCHIYSALPVLKYSTYYDFMSIHTIIYSHLWIYEYTSTCVPCRMPVFCCSIESPRIRNTRNERTFNELSTAQPRYIVNSRTLTRMVRVLFSRMARGALLVHCPPPSGWLPIDCRALAPSLEFEHTYSRPIVREFYIRKSKLSAFKDKRVQNQFPAGP